MLFRRDGQSLFVHTPAKLNLFLDVLRRCSDGFHELETLMVAVGIYDTLSFTEEKSGRIVLRCSDAASRCMAVDGGSTVDEGLTVEKSSIVGGDDAYLPTGSDNLVVRAAKLLKDYAGVDNGVRIHLYKRIPMAAGLAGGSSDAAATLAALNRLWHVGLTIGELRELASQLGSDVGFFLGESSAAICRGRGERIEPLRLPFGIHFVIVRPQSGLATSLVYKNCQPSKLPKDVKYLARQLEQGRLGAAAQLMYNSLQVTAEQLNSDVTKLKEIFLEEPVLGHMMSGSGTAYFGMCAGRRQARRVAARFRAARLGSAFAAQSRP